MAYGLVQRMLYGEKGSWGLFMTEAILSVALTTLLIAELLTRCLGIFASDPTNYFNFTKKHERKRVVSSALKISVTFSKFQFQINTQQSWAETPIPPRTKPWSRGSEHMFSSSSEIGQESELLERLQELGNYRTEELPRRLQKERHGFGRRSLTIVRLWLTCFPG